MLYECLRDTQVEKPWSAFMKVITKLWVTVLLLALGDSSSFSNKSDVLLVAVCVSILNFFPSNVVRLT